ncbi:General alpha-glucoside permease [Erysiphe necator]|nr:General alpha-glucoside permease [Erysiphe necator]
MAAHNLATLNFPMNSNSCLEMTAKNDLSVHAATPKQGADANPASCLEPGQASVNHDATRAKTRAEKLEREMSVTASWKLWRPASYWSILLSLVVIMEGYANLLLAQFYAMPAFCQRYGVIGPHGTYEIPTLWQAGLSIGCLAGETAGLCTSAIAVDRLGYRKTMIISLLALVAFINIIFFSQSLVVLLIGEILCGVPLGVFQTLSCTYASDVCPMKLRPFLTTYTNLCWLIGQLLSSGVLRMLVGRSDQWSYRIALALQWACPLPVAIAIFFAPESPWWLVRHGRKEEARKALTRLTNSKDQPSAFSVDDTLSMIIITNDSEKNLAEGAGFQDCFISANVRRTEISCMTWAIQNLCGSALMGYSTYFFVQAGLPTQMAFNMSLGQYGIGIAGTFFSWYLMSRYGRRSLFGGGLFLLLLVLLGIGSAGVVESKEAGWVIVSLLILFTVIYNSTVGPITYCLVSEIPSTRMKNKTVVLARSLCNSAGILNHLIVPYMLNPLAWNWGGKSGLFWGGICVISLAWTFYRLPEPKNRSHTELDELFKRKVPARRFSTGIV